MFWLLRIHWGIKFDIFTFLIFYFDLNLNLFNINNLLISFCLSSILELTCDQQHRLFIIFIHILRWRKSFAWILSLNALLTLLIASTLLLFVVSFTILLILIFIISFIQIFILFFRGMLECHFFIIFVFLHIINILFPSVIHWIFAYLIFLISFHSLFLFAFNISIIGRLFCLLWITATHFKRRVLSIIVN